MGKPAPRERQPVVLVLLLSALAVSETCAPGHTGGGARSSESVRPPQPSTTPTPMAERDLFSSKVAPMLARTCSPCHVPGGTMYERLPFDRPEVVSSHAEGVRKRLKGENRQTLEFWLATLPAPPLR
jgi:hypothetical protein